MNFAVGLAAVDDFDVGLSTVSNAAVIFVCVAVVLLAAAAAAAAVVVVVAVAVGTVVAVAVAVDTFDGDVGIGAAGFCLIDMMLHMLFVSTSLYNLVLLDEFVTVDAVALAFAKGQTAFVSA